MNVGARGHGRAMGAVLVPILLILIVLVAGAVLVRRFTSDSVEQSDRLQSTDRPTLRYQVPPGQDPAVVVAALSDEGYEVSPDSEPGPSSPIVIIGRRGGGEPDREAVRASLTLLDETNIDPPTSGPVERGRVRFLDE
jgi:hypothetical protein